MRKIFIILIFAIISSCSSAYAVDERMSDIYYGNGILTTEEEAYGSRDVLSKTILDEVYHGDEDAMHARHGSQIQVAYNYTAKKNFGPSIGGALDLMESYEQLTNTSFGGYLDLYQNQINNLNGLASLI